jgi:hypothetical protein
MIEAYDRWRVGAQVYHGWLEAPVRGSAGGRDVRGEPGVLASGRSFLSCPTPPPGSNPLVPALPRP